MKKDSIVIYKTPVGTDTTMLIFLCGLFFFFLGLEGLKRGLRQLAGYRLRTYLARSTGLIIKNIGIGTLVTAVLQSSSAVAVILIALLESRLLGFRTALALMLGANLGTTLTLQIMSLPVFSFYPYFMIMGVFFMCFFWIGCPELVKTGIILFFVGVLFLGFTLMIGCFKNPESYSFIALTIRIISGNRYLALGAGVLLTGLVQSSSLVSGILVGLAYTQVIPLDIAIAFVLGSNLGTCVTAFLASLGGSGSSLKLAVAHFIFNLYGVILIFPWLVPFSRLIVLTTADLSRQIANAHTLFNLINLFLFLPVFNKLVDILGGTQNVN
ncbi:MAG: Na/Pi cotransporter family protein [Bacillota bacterium]